MAEQQVQLTDLEPAQLQEVKKQLDQVSSSPVHPSLLCPTCRLIKEMTMRSLRW